MLGSGIRHWGTWEDIVVLLRQGGIPVLVTIGLTNRLPDPFYWNAQSIIQTLVMGFYEIEQRKIDKQVIIKIMGSTGQTRWALLNIQHYCVLCSSFHNHDASCHSLWHSCGISKVAFTSKYPSIKKITPDRKIMWALAVLSICYGGEKIF